MELKSVDCFEMLRIINKMDVKKDIIDILVKITGLNKKLEKVQRGLLEIAEKENKTTKEVCSENVEMVLEFDKLEGQIQGLGMEIVFVIIENIPYAETEVYKLLARMNNITVKDVKEWDAEKLINEVKEIIANESFKRFFTSIMR